MHQYKFRIRHIDSKYNAIADYFSRYKDCIQTSTKPQLYTFSNGLGTYGVQDDSIVINEPYITTTDSKNLQKIDYRLYEKSNIPASQFKNQRTLQNYIKDIGNKNFFYDKDIVYMNIVTDK